MQSMYSHKFGVFEIKKTKGCLKMSDLDHLLIFIDNGGRRSYIERRRNSRLARISERRTGKERRINHDRRKIQNGSQLMRPERRKFLDKAIKS
jgi:hypothetical protein